MPLVCTWSGLCVELVLVLDHVVHSLTWSIQMDLDLIIRFILHRSLWKRHCWTSPVDQDQDQMLVLVLGLVLSGS